MESAWQNLIVLAIVLTAGGYLCRLGWQSMARRKSGACGGCANCPSESTGKGIVNDEPQVVSIGPLEASARRTGGAGSRDL
jgi:attachment p12 family protein